MCVFFSHAYAVGIDDPNYDWNNHVKTSPWSHNKVTPYNTAGSTQNDYWNSSKYNVNSSRDVTSNGSKYKQTVNVAVEVSKAEKLATIANRAKNYAKYAKEFGKASLPAFVGSAALTALIHGIGWVMDEGGKITKIHTDEEILQSTDQYCYNVNGGCYTLLSAQRAYVQAYYPGWYYSKTNSCDIQANGAYCSIEIKNNNPKYGPDNITIPLGKILNPSYDPTAEPEIVEVPLDEMADLLQKAMDKSLADNNQALASAVAQAIKDAFSESDLDKDPVTGDKTNPIADKTKKALDEKGATELAEKEDPTVCVPNIGDLEGMCTNMPKSEADALPTLTCVNRPIVSANSCVYEADPNAPPKTGTVDKPKFDPETGDLPDACVWFDVHCKWLEWTKDDDLSDDTELDLDHQNEPESNTEIAFDGLCPANKVVQLPAPFNFEMTFSYEPYCLVAEKIKPAVVACGLFISALILGGIRGSD